MDISERAGLKQSLNNTKLHHVIVYSRDVERTHQLGRGLNYGGEIQRELYESYCLLYAEISSQGRTLSNGANLLDLRDICTPDISIAV